VRGGAAAPRGECRAHSRSVEERQPGAGCQEPPTHSHLLAATYPPNAVGPGGRSAARWLSSAEPRLADLSLVGRRPPSADKPASWRLVVWKPPSAAAGSMLAAARWPSAAAACQDWPTIPDEWRSGESWPRTSRRPPCGRCRPCEEQPAGWNAFAVRGHPPMLLNFPLNQRIRNPLLKIVLFFNSVHGVQKGRAQGLRELDGRKY